MADRQQSLKNIKQSVESVKSVLESLEDFELKPNGLDIINVKCQNLAEYLQKLTLLTSFRLTGSSVQSRNASEVQSGDLVDELIKLRVIHEKTRNLQSKMRYRIDKLLKSTNVTEENDNENNVDDEDDQIDPLAFKPNPSNLLSRGKEQQDDNDNNEDDNDGIYRPPKLAAVPYTNPEKGSKREKKNAIPAAILPELVGSNDVHQASTSGLGTVPSKQTSKRAKELARLQEYEEENMTRLVHNKKEANRRARDEADIALGGGGVLKGRRVGGLEGEFDDVLRAVNSNPSKSGNRSGVYDELNKLSKKSHAFDRAKQKRKSGDTPSTIASTSKKRGRFDRSVGDAARKKKKKDLK